VVLRWVIVACVVACSSPPKPYVRPERHPPIQATSDRANPLPIAIGWRSGEIKARAPHAGTFWFAAEIPHDPGDLTTIRVYIRKSESPTTLSLALVDAHDDVHEASKGNVFTHELKLVDVASPPPPILIRVSTARPQKFTLGIELSHRAVPEPPKTPCDPLHIDRNNPECEGVDPPCNLVSPDITNRNCCFATSCNLVSGCFANVTARVSKNTLRLSMGTRDGIMTMAQGLVTQRNQRLSKGHVESVEEDALIFRVDEPEKLDESILLSRQTQVRLMQPEWCRPARPIHNVDAAPSP
jgi:hypothetical protein